MFPFYNLNAAQQEEGRKDEEKGGKLMEHPELNCRSRAKREIRPRVGKFSNLHLIVWFHCYDLFIIGAVYL